MRYSIGVDISRRFVRLGLFDEEKRLVSRRSMEADGVLLPADFFDAIARGVRSFMEEKVITNDNIVGVGIGTPSIVKAREGYIIKTFGLDKLKSFKAAEYLSDRLGGVRVVVDSCGNAGALAELRCLMGHGRSDFVWCRLGDEFSAGVISKGELFIGASGTSGLNTHCIILSGEHFDCECGNFGCAASWGAGNMIVKHTRELIAGGAHSIIEDIAGGAGDIRPEHISIAYERGDALAESIVARIGRYIGTWIYNTHTALDMDYFVLSGSLLGMGKKLLGPIRKSFDSLNHAGARVEFANTRLGQDADIIGAMELLHDK